MFLLRSRITRRPTVLSPRGSSNRAPYSPSTPRLRTPFVRILKRSRRTRLVVAGGWASSGLLLPALARLRKKALQSKRPPEPDATGRPSRNRLPPPTDPVITAAPSVEESEGTISTYGNIVKSPFPRASGFESTKTERWASKCFPSGAPLGAVAQPRICIIIGRAPARRRGRP